MPISFRLGAKILASSKMVRPPKLCDTCSTFNILNLYSPLSVSEFFSHPILNMVFFNNVGKEEYIRIKSYFKMPRLDLSGYKEITTSFDNTYKSKSYTNFELENNEEVVKKVKRSLSYETMFDFDTFLSSMPKSLLNEKALTKSVKELITNVSFLYCLDPMTMSDIAKISINEKGLIDKELLKDNARKYYEFNNSGKLPSLIYKNQKEYLRNKSSDDTIKNRIINAFETTNPYDFLKRKYKGVKPTSRDMKILEMLVIDLKLNPGVVNVLIDYILKYYYKNIYYKRFNEISCNIFNILT